MTDASGRARATVQLGEKIGIYTIEARSIEDNAIIATFTVQATHGVPAIAWQRSVSANSDTIGSTLSRFAYAITDGDTNAVGNHTIAFAIANKPSGAIGDSLLNPVTITDTITGEASVALQMGDKVGDYIVSAEDPSVPNSKLFFSGKATHGDITQVNSFIPLVSDTIGTTLPPFGMTLADRGDNAIDNMIVQYRLVNPPDSVLARLNADSVMTDSTGRASVRLALGDKVGSYTVQASLSAMPTVTQEYIFTAIHGVPQKLLAERGQNQSKPIMQVLDVPFEIHLMDRANNPIPNDTVSFTITGMPSATSGCSLSTTTAVTDINGLASTLLTLGDKVGTYTVNAASIQFSMQQEFIAAAIHGLARTLAYSLGANQHKQILTYWILRLW